MPSRKLFKLTLLFAFFVFLALSPSRARAFGSKRIIQPAMPDVWVKARRALLNGLYREGGKTSKIDPAFLGPVQTGPLLVIDRKGREWLELTTIDHGVCRLLKKPRKQLELPEAETLLEKIDCATGKEYDEKAELEPVAGFGTISAEGRAVLNELGSFKWRAARDCLSEGNRRTFAQTLELKFTDNPLELDLNSQGDAFSVKSVCVSREWPRDRIVVKRLQEQRTSTGGWRFLVWGRRPYFDTAAETGLVVAAVNPVLMSAPEQLTLHSGSRVCAGAKCYRLRELELTQLLSARYLVIGWEPSAPERLTVTLFEVTPEATRIELNYTERASASPPRPQ